MEKTMAKERVEDLPEAVLLCVEKLSQYLKQDAMASHDCNDNMIFIWTFEQDGDPVQLHMLKTLNGGYAVAAADFGQDGKLANKWTKQNRGHFKAVKRIISQTAGVKTVHDAIGGDKNFV